jgi:hypothetical protein
MPKGKKSDNKDKRKTGFAFGKDVRDKLSQWAKTRPRDPKTGRFK